MTLLEKYSNRLKVAESLYSKTHSGAPMDTNQKLCVATCLDNVSRYLTEAFNSSEGTQRTDMGA